MSTNSDKDWVNSAAVADYNTRPSSVGPAVSERAPDTAPRSVVVAVVVVVAALVVVLISSTNKAEVM